MIGDRLGLPVAPRGRGHFGRFGDFAGGTLAAFGEHARALTGWQPTGPDLITDINQPGCYAQRSGQRHQRRRNTAMNMLNLLQTRPEGPPIERVRHQPRLRSLQVESTVRLTPGMLRIGFCGEDLADFTSLGFDDHVKLFVPTAPGEAERRDYTPRRFDAASRTLFLDFAVHDAGPATRWALNAKPGDAIQIGGPKGSAVISHDIRRWLLIGDETALPAIGRRIEEADAGTQVTSVAAVAGPDDRQVFETRAEPTALWAYRPLSAAADPGALLDVVRRVHIRPDTFVWIAAEAVVARAIRDHVVGERGYPRSWVKAGGYWIKGSADAHERIA